MPESFKINATLFGDGPLIPINLLHLSQTEADLVRAVGTTMKAYVDSAAALSQGKYNQIRERIPTHLRKSGRVTAIICQDGMIARYEHDGNPEGVAVGCSPESVTTLAPIISQQMVHCYKDRNLRDAGSPPGMQMALQRQSATGPATQTIATSDITLRAVLERPSQLPSPPNKPYCLVSARNTIELHLLGRLTPTEASELERDFIVRSHIRLPVAWECIEVYPFVEEDNWKPEYASVWAENDILGAVVASQLSDTQFQTLDPNASARRSFAVLLKKYKDLLDSNPEREEILQVFVKENPVLLFPAHARVWPKLALGPWKTDFVFREAAGDYLLVELERSTHRLFISDGHTSSELNHARGQIADWKRYLEDNLAAVQRELGLTGISSNPKSLVVIGRSASLTPDNRRKLVTMENESPKLRVLTYDDVYENSKAIVENLLGPIMDEGENTQIYILPANN